MTKRLFLVAGYDAHGIVDAALVHLVKSLSQYGDVIFCMDSDSTDAELNKIKPYVLHAVATRHGEYDFGSYMRAYTYARDAHILKNYKYMYLVNDSVYGPLYDLGTTLDEMENFNTDAFGIIAKPHPTRSHIGSWFFGCRQSVFLSTWFDEFMTSIKKLDSKGAITRIYEHGLSANVISHGGTWRAIWMIKNRGVYNDVKRMYRRGVPFIKRASFPRHGGALGRQILYVLNHINPDTCNAIMENARRTWGAEYIDWLLTKNPIKILFRNIKYTARKIFTEGI